MKSRLSLLATLATGCCYLACQNPTDQVDLGLRSELPTVVELRFSSVSGPMPAGLQVSLTGPDANQLVNTLNRANFRVGDDGVLKLALTESATPTANHPLRFTVVAEATGALKMVQSVQLTSRSPRTIAVPVLSSQTGQALAQAGLEIGPDGQLTRPLTLQTPETGGKSAVLSLLSGTRLQDEAGSPIEGKLTFRMHNLAANGSLDAASLPEQGVIATPNGRVASEGYQLTTVLGAVEVTAFTEKGRSGKHASQPMEISIPLPADARNPQTGQLLRAGDTVPLFLYDRATGRWSEEIAGRVATGKPHGLTVLGQITKLGYYVAGYRSRICTEGATFKVKSSFRDYDRTFRTQVHYVDRNGQDSSLVQSQLRTLNNDEEIVVNNLPAGKRIRLKAFEEGPNAPGFVASEVVTTCTGKKGTLDVRSFTIPASVTRVSFVIDFPCSNVDAGKLPETVTTQYRPAGTTEWQDLVTLAKKDLRGGKLKGVTYRLAKGKPYDLRLKLLTYEVLQTNYTLESDEYIIPVKIRDFCK